MENEEQVDEAPYDEIKDEPDENEEEEVLALYRQSIEAARREQEAIKSCLSIKLDLRMRAEAKQARGARGAVSPSQQPPAHKRTKLQEGKTVFY